MNRLKIYLFKYLFLERPFDFYHIFKHLRLTHFRKKLYLCHNEPVKMDIGNLFHGVIVDAM